MRTKRRIEREQSNARRKHDRQETKQLRALRRQLKREAGRMEQRGEAFVASGATIWMAPKGTPPPGQPDAHGDIWPEGWTKVGELTGPVSFSHVDEPHDAPPSKHHNISIGFVIRFRPPWHNAELN